MWKDHANKYPLFGTKTGWHCCSKSMRESDLRQLGVGITVYFKLLKFLMLLFLWFSFLSIPSYFFYYTSNPRNDEALGNFQMALTVFSLGNLGQCKLRC